MPTLDWIGKKAVEKHHEEVPFHLLKCDNSLSVGNPGSGNLIVQGDNLLALKALLPYYAGKVKCIYIDPPYNTGKENWVYNDNVNSPEIKEWLGRVVGNESEDLSRHDKWLCMMRPRLELLKSLLSKDGVMFVSIDDIELPTLRHLLDAMFGQSCFVGVMKRRASRKSAHLSKSMGDICDYVVAYCKDPQHAPMLSVTKVSDTTRPVLNAGNAITERVIPAGRPAKCEDGCYRAGSYKVRSVSFELLEEAIIENATLTNTVRVLAPFRVNQDIINGTVYITSNFGLRRYLMPEEMEKAKVMSDLIDRNEFYNEAGKEELDELFGKSPFDTPKPSDLIQYLISSISDPGEDFIVLDSFSGSGTTAHSVIKINREDGGNRKFILVEMDKNICENITAERVKRVAEGYTNQKGQLIEGLGGGFRYCTLGETLFDADGEIRKEVKFSDLARHIYLSETGEPLPKQNNGRSPLLGVHNGTAYYLLYNGILGDRTPEGGNVLTRAVLAELPEHEGPKVVFGTGNRLSAGRLKQNEIAFKQIPFGVKVK